MSSIDAVSPSSLLAPKVATVLEQLHRRARTDMLRILRVAPFVVPDFFGMRKVDDDRLSRHMRATYLPVSRSQGQMLYELDASKHAKAREHLREAGLEELTDIRLGDALQTLASVEGPIDMVLLDGWKDSYLPVLKLLQPKLKPRAIVLADNIFRFKRALRTYVEYVESGTNGFVSSTLEIADGFELSVFTG
jgi:hypothetical protein